MDDELLFNDLVKILNLKTTYKIKKLERILSRYETKRLLNCTSLKDWETRFLEVKKAEGLKASTLRYYKGWLDKLCEMFGADTNPEMIARAQFNSLLLNINEMEHISQNSKWQDISAVKNFWNWLEGEHAISKNYMRNIKFKQKKNTRHPLSDDEVEALRKACKTTEEKCMIEFLLTTGCRISEVPIITYKDINLHQRTCSVLGKGSKRRVVIFSKRCATYIRQLKKEQTDDVHVFCDNRNKPIDRGQISNIVKRVAKRAKIKDSVYVHRLRHTFASQCLEKGMDLISIQKLLGHSHLSTTQIYAETTMSNIKKEYDKIYGE